MDQTKEPESLILSTNSSPQKISNIYQSSILISNNIDTGIPSPIRFLMGLMIPVFLLIIPFTLFPLKTQLVKNYHLVMVKAILLLL